MSRTRTLVSAAVGVLMASLPAAAMADHNLREYVVPGPMAWEEASQNGFSFSIQYGMCFDDVNSAKCVPDDGHSSAPHDGYRNQLGLARFEAGSMIVERFATQNREPRSYVFTVFGEKDLADGWEIKDVELLGTYIIEEMEFRPDGPSDEPVFKLRLHESRKEQRSVKIVTLTLLGPPGQQWQDAFRKAD